MTSDGRRSGPPSHAHRLSLSVKPASYSLFSFLLFPLFVEAQSQDNAARISQLIVEADTFADKTFDNKKALEKYQEALSLDSLNYEVLWKISRSSVIIGEHLPAITDEQKEGQLQAYEEAVRYAEKAVAVDPNGSMGYTQRAAANSRVALFKNIWKSSGLMNDVREDCGKAIDLDPKNAQAYDILGRAHLRLSQRMKLFRWPFGIAWGNTDDAALYFEKAISIQPNFISYRIDAAWAHMENKEYQKARDHLSVISTLPTLSEDDERLRKEAADLLEQIKNK